MVDLRQPKSPAFAGCAALYTKGERVFEANYRAGLRVLDSRRVAAAQLREVGYFDIYPADDQAEFNGAWSSYP
jgi:hypothetical protein